MERYKQFEDIHAIMNLDVLKWWLNSHQISPDQLSTEQRIKLQIIRPFEDIVEKPDVCIGDVYQDHIEEVDLIDISHRIY